MKKLLICLAISLMAVSAIADTGREGSVRDEYGALLTTSQVQVSSQAATLIVPAGVFRASLYLENISSSTLNQGVYISSSSSVTTSNGYLITASNIPNASLMTFGQYTGAIYGIAISSTGPGAYGPTIAVAIGTTLQP